MSACLILLGVALAGANPAIAAEEELDPDRVEISLAPALGYDSDLGMGVGIFGTIAQFDPGYRPYRWRLEALFSYFIQSTVDGLKVPFQENRLLLDLPGLMSGDLRLNLRASFSRHNNRGYFGMGNAAPLDQSLVDANHRFYQVDQIFPIGEVNARIAMAKLDLGRFDLLLGSRYTHVWLNPYPDSKLERDLAGGDPTVKKLLVGAEEHGNFAFLFGISFDSRDHETVPSCGMFHEISLRGGKSVRARFSYWGANLTLRFFYPIYKDLIVVGSRLMADLLGGSPPFYKLSNHGGLFPRDATGGGQSIRGVMAQRYHGKIRVLGNLETRFKIWPFRLFEQRFHLGAAVFGDVGRVWAEFEKHPELDGTSLGLKSAFGAGLRMQWGETFVARGDFAYAPSEDTFGVYVDMGHVF